MSEDLVTVWNNMTANFNLSWIPGIIAASSLLSAFLVSFINNFWLHKIEKQKQSHEKTMLDIKNNHELNIKKIAQYQEVKMQSINDFMASAGKYYAFEQNDNSRIELYSSFAKVLPYLDKVTAEEFDRIIIKKTGGDDETVIYKLAQSLHSNDISPPI